MKYAKVIFYKDDANVTLVERNAKGGSTYTLFETVSELVNTLNEKGIDVDFDNVEIQ